MGFKLTLFSSLLGLLLGQLTIAHNYEQPLIVNIYVKDEPLIPGQLADEEQETTMEKTVIYQGVRVQEQPARMHYPYIDGASRECLRLTEKQLQLKREHPEVSITCKGKNRLAIN